MGAVDNETFLLCCLQHTTDPKIDLAAVAKDLGYASATVVGNRLRSLRKKLQSEKDEKQKEPEVSKEKKDTETKPKPAASSKPKRSAKRKRTSRDDENETTPDDSN
ncbi:hypothetical protein Dda_3966 [Drechslerella dactyloides]|uniref:Myb-like DNA-binding domain-containing protein n=1 Tax=Drechslerella dactyloides TaxID=74499 RepID=A0AAD6J3C4_DREDA|nr:hypothetical protein Dda_3966 [Drechslerella dactyloides]